MEIVSIKFVTMGMRRPAYKQCGYSRVTEGITILTFYIIFYTFLRAKMLNFNLMTERDRREAAAIEKRRLFEEERKKRIFNPRQRRMGLDLDVLQKQVAEKEERDSEERKVTKAFDDHLRKADQIAVALEEKEKQERLKIQQEINNYRKVYQKPEDRREFDLNDPDYIKKQLPARLYDDDPRLGVSSAQKFEGEDRASEQRAKVQREEIRAWLNQQISEKNTADRERRAADEAYRAAVMARDMRAAELDGMERECRRRLQLSCLRFNQALAEEKKCERLKRERENREDDTAEIYNALTSDLLTENPEVAQSNLGVGRVIPALSKGTTPEQKQKMREEQLRQIEEKKARKQLEERRNWEVEDYINGIHKTIYFMDRELAMQQKSNYVKLAEENKRLAEEQNQRKRYLDSIVYFNKPSDDFFDQFNKSSR